MKGLRPDNCNIPPINNLCSKEDLTNSLMSACVHNPEFSILLGDVIQNMILNWSIKEQIEEKELERMKHGDN